MAHVLADLRLGFRMLAKNPSLAVIAIVAFSLGIGLTTITFSLVYGALLRGLPFERPEQLIHIEEARPEEGIESRAVAIPDFVELRARQTAFEDLAGFYMGSANLAGAGDRPERYFAAYTTASMFDLLRVRPLLGRTLTAEDDATGAPSVVVIGHDLWQNRFGGDQRVIGRTIRLNGQSTVIVGVMPPGFRFPMRQDLWTNLRPDPHASRTEGRLLEVFGRLKDGVTVEAAGAELATIMRRLGELHPETNAGVTPLLKPYTEEFIGPEPVAMLYTMLAAVFGVLLIACANVANLLLARAAVRTREVAIRTALGASRTRVIGQLLAESFVLALVGAAIGLGIAAVGLRIFNDAIAPTRPPFWIDIRLHPAVLIFSAGLTLLAAVVAGLVPALQASGAAMHDVLKDESRGSSSLRLGRMSRWLVVGEVALSCALLVSAGLMVKSVTKLRNVDFGFPVDRVFTAEVALLESVTDTAARIRFVEELLPRLAAIPGVTASAVASTIPGEDGNYDWVAIEGRAYAGDRDYPEIRYSAVTPEFFRLFDAQAIQGRVIEPGDRFGTLPVAVVNTSFAAKHFPGESPLGRRIRLGRSDSKEPWLTVVGVVPDRHMDGVENEEPEGLYIPLVQFPHTALSIVARTAGGDPMLVSAQVARAVAEVDPDLPVFNIMPHRELIERRTWFYRVFGTLFMVFGAVALFLAAIGLYGVMAFSVTRRRQELGVRMALGATARAVVRLVLSQGVRQLAIGTVLGLGGAILLGRGLGMILFGVDATDVSVYLAIVVVLGLTGLLACLVPARRATRIEPLTALRAE